MKEKYWIWCASCPCGYQSAWHFQEWFARLITYLHAILSGHKRGDMTVAAKEAVRYNEFRSE